MDLPALALLLTRRAALVGLAVVPLPAQAHAILQTSQPALGANIPPGVVAFRLQYNSRIDRVRSRLTLVGPDRSQTTLTIAPEGPPDVLASSADLKSGAYTVRWQVLAIDGHITRGDVPFTVEGP
ncbi:MAG: copper resistance protein CopC [Acetobacteraceae bacterium]|nr:copper resistance protein CopC [Acetobacteraceae bacterium]